MKLNSLINRTNVKILGFTAFKQLEDYGYKHGHEVFISTLPPNYMMDIGIFDYCSPVLTRGTVFNCASEIIDANLDVDSLHIKYTGNSINDFKSEPVIIVSRHAGTVRILTELFDDCEVYDHVSAEQISGKIVVGTLPPTLIQYCKEFISVNIYGFDHVIDKDIDGEELLKRIIISEPINVYVEQIDIEEFIKRLECKHEIK